MASSAWPLNVNVYRFEEEGWVQDWYTVVQQLKCKAHKNAYEFQQSIKSATLADQ